jgi:hypothetical protein
VKVLPGNCKVASLGAPKLPTVRDSQTELRVLREPDHRINTCHNCISLWEDPLQFLFYMFSVYG